jgi:hypothetical protein
MSKFTVYPLETAPESSKLILEKLKASVGMILIWLPLKKPFN